MPKKKTVLMEPEAPAMVQVEAPAISEGTIGVEYTPPPVGETSDIQTYDCANCRGLLTLRCERCPTCNELIDWTSLDDNI
jgi:hypothetical protein